MSAFSSRIQILVVENELRKAKVTGKEYQHFEAHSICLDDAGQPICVGVLRDISPEIRATCVPGIYRADFAMQRVTYGDKQGQIVAMITKLTPEPAVARRGPANAAVPA